MNFPIIMEVSKSIGKDWKWLGRSLGLDEHKLRAIENDHKSDGIDELAHIMLQSWKEEMPEAASVEALAHHLQQVSRKDLALKILELAKASQISSPGCGPTTTRQLPQGHSTPKLSDSGIANITMGDGATISGTMTTGSVTLHGYRPAYNY